MNLYESRPYVVKAIQFDGTNQSEIPGLVTHKECMIRSCPICSGEENKIYNVIKGTLYTYIDVGDWIIYKEDDSISVMTNKGFQAKYTPHLINH